MSRRLQAVWGVVPLLALGGCSGAISGTILAENTTAPPTTAAPISRSTRASPPAATKTPGSASIPETFLGSWNTDRAQCGTDSEGSLTVQPHHVTFYEGGGPVTSVARNGDVLTLTATLTSEGTRHVETFRLTVSTDGQTLTDLSTETVRHRCL